MAIRSRADPGYARDRHGFFSKALPSRCRAFRGRLDGPRRSTQRSRHRIRSLRTRPRARPGANAAAENALAYRRNWGRWGADDQMGAVNLITPAKRAAAADLVKTGRSVSLSRNFEPTQQFIRVTQRRRSAPPLTITVPSTMGQKSRTWTPCAICGTRTACGTVAIRPKRSTRAAHGSPTSRRSRPV